MAIWFLIVPPMRPCDALGRSSAPMPMTRVTRYASYIVHACLLRQAVAAAEAREIAWATSTGEICVSSSGGGRSRTCWTLEQRHCPHEVQRRDRRSLVLPASAPASFTVARLAVIHADLWFWPAAAQPVSHDFSSAGTAIDTYASAPGSPMSRTGINPSGEPLP